MNAERFVLGRYVEQPQEFGSSIKGSLSVELLGFGDLAVFAL
jgi:hypothetical protein